MQKCCLVFALIISLLNPSCDSGTVRSREADNIVTGSSKSNTTHDTSSNLNTQKNAARSEVVADPVLSSQPRKYSLRKYPHVGEFFKRIAGPATELCVDNNVPPAAVLSIAALESGWNKGYVGRITGNILSLGARKGDYELPALVLPRLKSSNRILFDSLEILKYDPSEFEWEERPPSLKKDYRPAGIAGTKYQLAYFKYHPYQKARAQTENINDFLTIFISRSSRIAVYREARHIMDSLVSIHGKEILFEPETSRVFIRTIGGRPNSFNYRETWPKKVEYILRNAGLVELTKQLYLEEKNFDEVW